MKQGLDHSWWWSWCQPDYRFS